MTTRSCLCYKIDIRFGVQVEETNTQIKAYRQGDWFGPCWHEDKVCWRRFTAGMAAGTWDMEGLVGVHRFSGSWG